MPRRLSIFVPVVLLALCFLFLALYLDSALRVYKVPRMRFRPLSSLMVGLESGVVAGNGPYGVMGIYRPNPDSRNLLFIRGIGYVLRVDRVSHPEGFNHQWFVRIPHWFFAAGFATLSIFSLRRHLRLQRMWDRVARGFCPQCGYDLRASSGKCSECGMEVPVERASGRDGPALLRSST